MKFVKLQRGNDWGVGYYERHGVDHSVHGGCSFQRDAIMATLGRTVTIRFPDGTVESHPLCVVHHSTVVSDYGRDSHVEYGLPAVKIVRNGVASIVSLDDVEVAVDEHGEFA